MCVCACACVPTGWSLPFCLCYSLAPGHPLSLPPLPFITPIALAPLPVSCLCPLWTEALLLLPSCNRSASTFRRCVLERAASSLTSTLPPALPSDWGPKLGWPQEPQHLLDWILTTGLHTDCRASPACGALPCTPTPIATLSEWEQTQARLAGRLLCTVLIINLPPPSASHVGLFLPHLHMQRLTGSEGCKNQEGLVGLEPNGEDLGSLRVGREQDKEGPNSLSGPVRLSPAPLQKEAWILKINKGKPH